MPIENPFKIISVTGAHSKVGKTTLCSILLENLKGFGAIKFTKTPFYTSVVDDPVTIMKKDKDTAVMSGSGAEKVIWIKSPGRGLNDALSIAISKMNGLRGVFIIGKDGHIKPSALRVSKRADVVIINSDKHIADPSFLGTFVKENVKVFCMDLINRTGEIDKFLAFTKKYSEVQ
jgi:hypothetical protein